MRPRFPDGARRAQGFSLHWLALPFAGLVMGSCTGEAFSAKDHGSNSAETGGSSGRAGSGGAAGDGGRGGTSGRDGSGGSSGDEASGGDQGTVGGAAGDTSAGASGGSRASDAGDGGAGACEAHAAAEFAGHCYVDVTSGSSTEPEAEAACAELASRIQHPGHLLVLDSAAEQKFILERFLVAFTDRSDAWLALTCHELDQPDIGACYCVGCDAAELLEKQQAWKWIDDSSATFGWINQNPNEGLRCAALGYNSSLTIWGWVDRRCDESTFMLTGQAPHDYRTICEFEP